MASTDEELAPLSGWRRRGYIIIFGHDTPAGRVFDLSLLAMIGMSVIAVMLETVPSIQARFGTALATRLDRQYEMFRPERLLFTRLDETEVVGPILSEAARTERPVSFLTDGQRVPEDLHAAGPNELAELLFASTDARPSHQLSAA